MSTILAGHVQLQDQASLAREELLQAGFKADQISTFFVNQAGQHDTAAPVAAVTTSTGTDDVPVGVGEGMAVGSAVGAAVGAATAVVTGPVGPVVGALVGAHVGSLFGFSKMKEAGELDAEGGNTVTPRLPGMLVAVSVDKTGDETLAIDVFKRLGVHHIERAQGIIRNSDWGDFNPLSLPALVAT